MNARLMVLIGVLATTGLFAQSDQKFKLYGFADMTITKYLPKDGSAVRTVSLMDERLMFAFDHLNIYQEYRPNDRVRFLTEMSYQDKPPTYVDRPGSAGIPGFETEPKLADTNKVAKGIVFYEWGSFSVERAQMSVNFNRYLNLTFGKFITPAGIWNVDHGSPVIMTVNQPSQYTFREIYPKSQLGIMESGTYFIGDADLTYTGYLSTGRGNPVINDIQELAVGGQLRLGLPILDECNIGLSEYTGTQTAVLRTGTYDMMTFALSVKDHRMFRYREYVTGIDFRIRKSIFMLQSEFNYQFVNNTMRKDWADDSINTAILGTYVLGSVDAYKGKNLTVTPYAFWEYVKYFDTYNNPSLFGVPVDEGNAMAATANQYFLGYMKIMAGINMRIYQNFGIKGEFNFTQLYQAKQPDYSKFPPDPVDPNEIAEDKDGLLNIPGLTAQFYVAF